MIKEYHFAAVLYDEQEKQVRCAGCGHAIPDGAVMVKAGGRWLCGSCGVTCGAPPDESTMCFTVHGAVEG